MNWILCTWVVWALNTLCRGQLSMEEDYRLSQSGYHLCTHNETRLVSYIVNYMVPYTATKQCGGWLLWKTCQITEYRMTQYTEYKTVTEQVIRCCDGYIQVGHYCVLPVNRSRESTAKPGLCPTADRFYGSKGCKWDTDCPGWQKCCKRSSCSVCTNPTSSYYSDSKGHCFNATVTVKVDYKDLMSRKGGLLNHTRLLHAMVTGVLESKVSVYYLSSQPVYPYRTATSLMIECKFIPSLSNVTSVLHHLLKHIQEVSSVTVEDLDECTQPFLHRCSPHADCVNTVGSYYCTCGPEYTDMDPTNPGTNCTALPTPTPTYICIPPMSTTSTPVSNTTVLNGTMGLPTSVTTSEPTTTCPSPNITNLRSANVTSTSFRVHWSGQFPGKQSYQVILSKGSEVIYLNETSPTTVEMRGLQPGVLYDVTVTPNACGRQGNSLHLTIKTEALTLNATARLTNILYTNDLQNTTSVAYQDLTASIYMEIYQSLSPEMKALMGSGQVRIEIRGFAPGSVVVNFALIFTPSQSQDISNVSIALLTSLMNSSKYEVDKNSIIIDDFDECASEQNDCSPRATCTNSWASYTCTCIKGDGDSNPERPGRSCQGLTITTIASTTPPSTTTTVTSTTPTTIIASSRPPSCTNISASEAISVKCHEAAVTVTVARDFLQSSQINETALYLGMEACGVNGGNATHVQLTVAWEACNSHLMDNETYYTASVTLFNSINSSNTIEGPRIRLQIPVRCTYMKSMLISSDFGSMDSNISLKQASKDSLEEGSDTLYIVGMSCLGVGLAIFFIIGFVCLFYCQRNRIGNYNFNNKPKEENFTYLA